METAIKELVNEEIELPTPQKSDGKILLIQANAGPFHTSAVKYAKKKLPIAR